MAFKEKTDYCGLSTVSANFVVRDDNVNGSNEVYRPQGQDGSFVAVEVFGDDSAPSNSYGVKANTTLTAGAIKLNKITTVGNKPYALESVNIGTSAGSPVTLSATCQEVEAGATDAASDHYEVPALTINKSQSAQILFSAFTISGTGCELTDCAAAIACQVGKDKVAGTKIASDINSGLITVTGTILQTGATAPTLAAATGWTLTKPATLSPSNGETTYPTYTFEVTKALTRSAANGQSNG